MLFVSFFFREKEEEEEEVVGITFFFFSFHRYSFWDGSRAHFCCRSFYLPFDSPIYKD